MNLTRKPEQPADAWEAAKVEKVHAMGRELYDPGENQKAEQPARINEVIETHIEMLIDEDVLVRIGADKQPHRELGQRVMRIFEDYNRILVLESAKATQPAVKESCNQQLCEVMTADLKAKDERIEKLEKAIHRCLNAWEWQQDCAEKEWLNEALDKEKV